MKLIYAVLEIGNNNNKAHVVFLCDAIKKKKRTERGTERAGMKKGRDVYAHNNTLLSILF